MACDLCDLPTPDPPVTGERVDGSFCCRGCLAVATRLDDGAGADDTEEVQERPAETLDTGDADAEGADAFFAVDGMHCATCELFLEATATDHPAIADAQASYPTGSIRLVYDDAAADPEDLLDVLDGTGYAARPMDEDAPDEDGPAARLLVGAFFGMMTMLWYLLFLYPAYLGLPADVLLMDVHGPAGRYVLANTWVMATVVLGYTGYPILRGASVSLRARQPNMDLLVALAAGTAYVYSTFAMLLGSVEVYFDIAVVVVLVVTLGEYYKRRITDRATGALTDLTREQVGEARRRVPAAATAQAAPSTSATDDSIDDGRAIETVDVEDLAAGDEVVVHAGERVPLDGTVVEGEGTVDASLVTGESVPERREPGDEVVGGAAVSEGALVVAVDPSEDSTLDRVVRRLWTIQTASPGVQRLADRIALVFVPLVLVLALGAAAVHLAIGAGPVPALLTGLTVLIVSCPCALGLATPLAVASATREALDRGIAVLDESVFERATAVDVVAVDKTGTLTTGEMRVRDVRVASADGGGTAGDLASDGGERVDEAADAPDEQVHAPGAPADVPDEPADVQDEGVDTPANPADVTTGGVSSPGEAAERAARQEVLARAAALEQFAEHPVAAAIVDAAGPVDRTVTDLSVRPGLGVSGQVDGVPTSVGHPDLLAKEGMTLPADVVDEIERARNRGAVPAVVGWDGRARGVVVAGDEPRAEWTDALAGLHRDHEVVLITGDEPGAAARFRDHDAVDDVFAGVPPEGKAALVERLGDRGTVAMVGDGTNDAPALAAADVGIALSSGTALAADAADVVITSPDLGRIADVFALTRAARSRVRQNLGWAFGYNAIAVPLAAFGVLNPLLAAVAMTTSSLLVVANSARSLGSG